MPIIYPWPSVSSPLYIQGGLGSRGNAHDGCSAILLSPRSSSAPLTPCAGASVSGLRTIRGLSLTRTNARMPSFFARSFMNSRTRMPPLKDHLQGKFIRLRPLYASAGSPAHASAGSPAHASAGSPASANHLLACRDALAAQKF